MRSTAKALLACALLGLAVASLSACGSGGHQGESASTPYARVRDAVLRGAARDFAQGTGIGGPAFESCLLRRLGEALDRPTIARLVQVYRRPHGQGFASQALNILAAPLAARCGHRTYVPELVEASRGLPAASVAVSGGRELGVAYGPYLGVRCRRADHVGCDRVGIDVVFSTPARRVTAVVGGRRLALRTPGMHNGIRLRDWIGTIVDVDMDRPSSPFFVRGFGRRDTVWAGSPPVYVPVELRAAFVDGRSARASFPAVFLSPGWG